MKKTSESAGVPDEMFRPTVQSKSSNLPLAELKKRLAAQQKLFDNKAFIGKLSDKGAKIQTKIGDLRSEITQREVDLAAADLAGLTIQDNAKGPQSDAPYRTITGTRVQPKTKEVSVEESMGIEIAHNKTEQEQITHRAMQRLSLRNNGSGSGDSAAMQKKSEEAAP